VTFLHVILFLHVTFLHVTFLHVTFLHVTFLHVILLLHMTFLHVTFLHVILLHVILLHVTKTGYLGDKEGHLTGVMLSSTAKPVGYHVFASRNITNILIEVVQVH
jgi:hypothetical protein